MIYSRYRHLAIDCAKPAPTAAQLVAIERLLGHLNASYRNGMAGGSDGDQLEPQRHMSAGSEYTKKFSDDEGLYGEECDSSGRGP